MISASVGADAFDGQRPTSNADDDEIDMLKRILAPTDSEKKMLTEKETLTDDEFDTLDEMLSIIEDEKRDEVMKRKIKIAEENIKSAIGEVLENTDSVKRSRNQGK